MIISPFYQGLPYFWPVVSISMWPYTPAHTHHTALTDLYLCDDMCIAPHGISLSCKAELQLLPGDGSRWEVSWRGHQSNVFSMVFHHSMIPTSKCFECLTLLSHTIWIVFIWPHTQIKLIAWNVNWRWWLWRVLVSFQHTSIWHYSPHVWHGHMRVRRTRPERLIDKKIGQ